MTYSDAKSFGELIVEPNLRALLSNPEDVAAAVNTISAIDNFVGVFAFEQKGFKLERPDQDKQLRDDFALKSDAYRVIRDTAFAIQHGRLNGGSRIAREVTDVQNHETAWNDRGDWDDDLVWADHAIYIRLTQGDLPRIRADVISREAWKFCSAQLSGNSYTSLSLDDLKRIGVFS